MSDALLIGVGRYLIPVPRLVWRRQVSRAGPEIKAALGFMTSEHHVVRNFVVAELPRAGKPLAPEDISRKLNLPIPRVREILDDLERHLTFLFRDPQGAVACAYPVTTDQTPHRVAFSTGEQTFAA